MFCPKCGTQVGDNDKFCKTCGTPVNVQPAAPVSQQAPITQQPPVSQPRVQLSDEERKRRKKKGTILGIISMVILFVSLATVIPLSVTRVLDNYPAIGITVGLLSAVVIIVTYVLMIISLAKYRSTLSKVMIWIYGVILIITVISGIYMMYYATLDCYSECTGCVHHF